MKKFKYDCLIDSIHLRYNNLRVEDLYKEKYRKHYYENNHIVFLDNDTNEVLFSILTPTDQRGIEYQLVKFNGFRQYSKRDKLIEQSFDTIIKLLENNDINFYLSKIDLTIDFFDVKLEDLNIERKKGQGVRRQLLSEVNSQVKQQIENNDISFYFEKPTKSKSRTQRGYLYKTSKKHNSHLDVYRFEVEIRNFSDIEKLSLKDYKKLIKNEIVKRFEKYSVKCQDTLVKFDFYLLDDIIEKTNRL